MDCLYRLDGQNPDLGSARASRAGFGALAEPILIGVSATRASLSTREGAYAPQSKMIQRAVSKIIELPKNITFSYPLRLCATFCFHHSTLHTPHSITPCPPFPTQHSAPP